MKPFRTLFIFTLALTSFFTGKTQIAGSFTVPSDFPNMAAAINTLNVMGVAGSVTIHVNAGYTETVAAGGLKLFNVPGASSTNQVIFKKNGSGANPLLTAYSGGVATPTSAVQDGVWWFIGADFITVDGIDIVDPNTSNPSTMEFGYGFYNASSGDGCQNNTIKNCVVTLNKINASTGGTINPGGSRGIESIVASYTNNATALTPTSVTGTHSFNKFYSNIVQNCHNGIVLTGYQAPSPYTLADKLNDIGGTSAVTGNTVINFGGGTGGIVSGIRTKMQYSLNVSFNVLNNNNGAGADPMNDLFAINIGTAIATSVSINNNTISLTALTQTFDLYGIYTSASSRTLNISILNNVFSACNFTPSGTRDLIYEYSTNSISNISNNLFVNIIGSNSYNNKMITTDNGLARTINSNTLINYVSGSSLYFINANDDQTLTVSGNLVDNVSAHSCDLVFNATGTGTFVINATFTGNVMRNIVCDESFGIYTDAFSSSSRTITGNSFYNISTRPGNTYGLDFSGIYVRGGKALVSGNSIYSVTAAATTVTSSVYHITGISGEQATMEIRQNKLGAFYSQSKGGVYGIYLETSSNHTITNNVIGDLTNINSLRSDALIGIYTNSTTGNHYVYYNTVYLNSPNNSSPNFGSSAILCTASGTVHLKNNILVNTSVSTGTGVTAVIRKQNATMTYYSAASNNNLLYAGIPAANRLIYYDGTNTYSTLPGFKTFVSPKDAQSVTENPPFITTDATQINFLSLDPAIATQAESGGLPISGYTTDYAGTVRNSTTPDIGAWEGNFTQSDVFSPTITTMGFATPACNLSGRTVTVNFSDASGVASGTLSPRLYYRVNFGLYTSVQGTLTSGTSTNGVWTFNLNYSANVTDIIRYFFTAQDVSIFDNLALIPSTGGSVTSVNSVPVPPTTTYTYSIDSAPSISVSNGTICSGSVFTISPTGASTYSITGGSFAVSPAVTTSYTITGYNSTGCSSSPTTILITVNASPTLSINHGTICSGQSHTFTPSGADTYTITGNSFVVSPVATSVYTVAGTNTVAGCVAAPVTATLLVNTTPTVSVNSGSICSGNSFTINPSGASLYTVSGGNTIVSPASNTVYLVNGISAAGCVAANTATATITVAALPSISVNSGTICQGKTFTIVPSGAATYSFSGGTAIVSPASTSSYSVTGISAQGCPSSNTVVSSVQVLPTPTVTVAGGTICSGQSFTFTPGGASSYVITGGSMVVSPSITTSYSITGTSTAGCVSNTVTANLVVNTTPTISVSSGSICNGQTYVINPTGATVYSVTGGNFTVSPTANTSYTVSGSGAGTCIANSAVVNVSVFARPVVSISGGSVCAGSSFVLAPSGAFTYSYSSGTATVSPTGNTSYSVTGYSPEGCASVSQAVATVSVEAKPVLSISGPTAICSGSTASLSAAGANTFTWQSSVSGISFTAAPVTSTTYTLAGTAVNGCTSSVLYPLTVNTTPTIAVNSGTICAGQIFTVNPSGAINYSVTGNNFTVSPATNTIYTVTGSGAGGCISNQAISSVSVFARPAVSVQGGSICAGTSFIISPSGAVTYSFSSGTATVNPSSTTSYSITGFSIEGCASTPPAIATITVEALPVLNLSGPNNVCNGTTVTFSVTGANSYTWQSLFTGATFSVVATTSKVYTVTGVAANGCSNTAYYTLAVNQGPAIAVNGATAICEGKDISLAASGTAISYTWNTGYVGSVLSATPAASTFYTVSGTAINGCISSHSLVVVVSSVPPVKAEASSTIICKGTPVTLFGTGAVTYSWSAGISNNVPFTPGSSNIYTVTGSANNCAKSATILVQVSALPVVKIGGGADTLCSGQSLTLTADGANTYTWLPDGSNLFENTITPLTSTEYTLVGVDINGCRNSAVVMIKVQECLSVNEHDQRSGITIFPNPGSGIFSVHISGELNVSLIVRNALGQKISEEKLTEADQKIDLSSHAKGIYMAEILDNKGNKYVQRIVLQD